jgi:hypothetical protein
MVVKLSGGDVDVTAGTGFLGETVIPLVRLTVKGAGGEPVVVWIRPLEARAIGLDLIGAAHSAIADAHVRRIARRHGLDGDGLVGGLRELTTETLGPG